MDELPDSDVVAWGGEITVSNLVHAYGRGIFPWPFDPDAPVPWCSPDPRAVLVFEKMHFSKSLRRTLRTHSYRLSIDEAFEEVVRSCARIQRRPELGTWIFPDMIRGYRDLHEAGHAHSVEVWDGEDLVGGLYGVCVKGVFSGESMFHRRSDTSKLAVCYLVEHLKAAGLGWLDIQQLSPHFERFGAFEISREDYLTLLRVTQELGLRPFGQPTTDGGSE